MNHTELNVYCELHSCLVDLPTLQKGNVKGIILSGGPFSVYEEGAPHLNVSTREFSTTFTIARCTTPLFYDLERVPSM